MSRDKCNSLRVVLTIAGLMPSSEQRRRLRSLTDRGHNLLVIGTASRVNEIFDVEDEEVDSFMYEADDEELNLGRGRAGGGGQNMEERGKASTEDEDRGDAVAPSLRGVQAVVVDEAEAEEVREGVAKDAFVFALARFVELVGGGGGAMDPAGGA